MHNTSAGTKDPWQNPAGFAGRLSRWFAANSRPLPWRRQPTLYRTVVSEFMLQQTQVSTVLPYFDRWMRAFPDFATLANAGQADVLRHWEGLGYYQRARNLHALAAKWIAAKPKPRTAEAWLTYPGVGPYTAAAIASIAFQQPVAVVDGNVVRILARLRADATLYRDGPDAARRLHPVADALIRHATSPGMFNEAMMELGATVCRKTNPDCPLCPVRSHCAAGASGQTAPYPNLVRRKTIKRSIDRAWLVLNGHILLQRGSSHGRRLRDIRELPEFAPLAPYLSKGLKLLTKTRGISNERITECIHAVKLTAELPASGPLADALEWVPLPGLDQLTLSGPHRKWIREIGFEPGGIDLAR